MAWRVLYIIGKLLEFKCLKSACMTRSDIWNTSYGQKKGRESNWQFDFRPLKVRNRPDFVAFKWCATYRWKTLDKGYNFALNIISIRGLHAKLWGPQSHESLNFGNFGPKCHLDVGLVERHKVYYKGEGHGFPQVWDVVSLVSPSLAVVSPNTKNVPTMH
jgi:hypothetical protein